MLNGIIIPCYNEANRLKINEFQAFLNATNNYQLCFVNDGSADDTAKILKAFAAKNPNKVLFLDLSANVGKAEATRMGVYHLAQMTLVQTIGFLDADLATGFEDYTRLAETLNDNISLKMVIGSRKLDKENINRTAFRSFASNCFGSISSSITKLQIADTQCGAKVFDKETAIKIFKEDFISRWLFDLELLVRTRKLYGESAAEKILEVALNEWEEVEGSKITMKDAVEFPKQLAQIAITYNVNPVFAQSYNSIKSMSLNMRSAFNSLL